MKVVGIYPIQADEPVHLAELEIESEDSYANIGQITQEVPGQRRDNWQSPYMEQLLDEDGSTPIAEDFEIPNKKDEWKEKRRVVFFFHYLDLAKNLSTPWGDLPLPSEEEKPDRLKVEYEPPW